MRDETGGGDPERGGGGTERVLLEGLIVADMRELTSQSDWLARAFAEQNGLSANEFRALLFVMIAETKGQRLTAGELRKQMGLSGAAITYLIDRLAEIGHLRRDTDPADQRKVILRYDERGMEIARRFFTELATRNRGALEILADSELAAAHRVFGVMVAAMRDFSTEIAVRAPTRGRGSPPPDPGRAAPT